MNTSSDVVALQTLEGIWQNIRKDLYPLEWVRNESGIREKQEKSLSHEAIQAIYDKFVRSVKENDELKISYRNVWRNHKFDKDVFENLIIIYAKMVAILTPVPRKTFLQ